MRPSTDVVVIASSSALASVASIVVMTGLKVDEAVVVVVVLEVVTDKWGKLLRNLSLDCCCSLLTMALGAR